MDPFKRATLLASQHALGQVTSDEVAQEMKQLIPQMQADAESQPPAPPEPPIAAPSDWPQRSY